MLTPLRDYMRPDETPGDALARAEAENRPIVRGRGSMGLRVYVGAPRAPMPTPAPPKIQGAASDAVMAALADAGEGTPSEIARAAGVPKVTAANVLIRAARAGKIALLPCRDRQVYAADPARGVSARRIEAVAVRLARRHRGVIATDLADELSISARVASRALVRLCGAGELTARGRVPTRYYAVGGDR